MATARVAESFFIASRNAWIISIDQLNGTVQAGQQVTIDTKSERLGPFQIKAVEHLLKSASKGTEYVALVLASRQNDALDDLCGAEVEINDSLWTPKA